MSGERTVSDVLFDHSDSRVCRQLWQALEAEAEPPSLDAQIEVMRVTGGAVSLLVSDPVVERYGRWRRGRGFEHLAIAPPWHVVDYGRGDRATLREQLAGGVDPTPVLHEKTPFASGALPIDGVGR